MPELPIPVDLHAGGVARDYATIYADLVRLVPHFVPEWTYRGPDDLGVALLQVFAYLADHLHARNDGTLRDLRLSRTVYRHLARELAEHVGYLAARPTPARADVTFSVDAALAADLTIPAGTRVAADLTSGTVDFETDAAVVLVAGQVSVAASVTEGETVEDLVLGAATGRPNEAFRVADADMLFAQQASDATVTVGGREATFVRWSIEAGPDDLAFWVRELRDRSVEVRFGDGVHGSLLVPNSEVAITYRRGGGTTGRVAAGKITRVVDAVLLEGAPVDLDVTNAARTIGGLPEESIDEIRAAAPAFYRTQNRAVSRDDYDVLALGVPGVYRARAVATGINGVRMYVVPEGAEEGDVLTPALEAEILEAFEDRKMATDALSVAQVTLVPIDVSLQVRAHRGAGNVAVRERVRRVFRDPDDPDAGLLAAASNDIGEGLSMSDMIGAVEDVDGVDRVDVLRYSRRPGFRWISRTGDADVSADGVTISSTTQAQTWIVEFLDETRFSVRGSVSGLQPDAGELDVAYSDAAGEISFLVESGVADMGQGDRAEIRVSRLAWNVDLAADEFPVAGDITVAVTGGIG